MRTRIMLPASLVVAGCLAAIGNATAQVYPSRPVTIINPFPAGAPLDTIARVVGERIRTSLGQPIVIENVTGARVDHRRRPCRPSGARRLHAQPWQLDQFCSRSGALYRRASYDLLKDFEPVSLLDLCTEC